MWPRTARPPLGAKTSMKKALAGGRAARSRLLSCAVRAASAPHRNCATSHPLCPAPRPRSAQPSHLPSLLAHFVHSSTVGARSDEVSLTPFTRPSRAPRWHEASAARACRLCGLRPFRSWVWRTATVSAVTVENWRLFRLSTGLSLLRGAFDCRCRPLLCAFSDGLLVERLDLAVLHDDLAVGDCVAHVAPAGGVHEQ